MSASRKTVSRASPDVQKTAQTFSVLASRQVEQAFFVNVEAQDEEEALHLAEALAWTEFESHWDPASDPYFEVMNLEVEIA